MTSPTPLPSFIPHSATDTQMLQLIAQFKSGGMSAGNALFLVILLELPIPESWLPLQTRLDWYYAHSSSSNILISTINAHPVATFFFVTFWPIWLILFLAFMYQFLKLLFRLAGFCLSILIKKFIQAKPQIFLELTFPINTNKSAYSTDQLFTLIHTLGRERGFIDGLLPFKKIYSLEIASTRDKGIKYFLTTPSQKDAQVIKRSLLSYLPGIKVQQVEDYLGEDLEKKVNESSIGVTELKLSNHFALPLQDLKVLSEHDPISYLAGNMTKLQKDDLLAFQIVVTPIMNSTHQALERQMRKLRITINKGELISPKLFPSIFQKIVSLPFIYILWIFIKINFKILMFLLDIAFSIMVGGSNRQTYNNDQGDRQNSYEKELAKLIKSKIEQHLYETSIRLLIITKDPDELDSRSSGLASSFGQFTSTYQSIGPGGYIPIPFTRNLVIKRIVNRLKNRELLSPLWGTNPILSTSEVTDIYHLPYSHTSKTEDMVKLHSKELPAPLSLKGNKNLDVAFGVNTYGGEETAIGLTEEERQTHMYILGRTGSGKTTLMSSMAREDIEKGRGLAFIDPHGDVADDLLASIPLSRKNDLVYINPRDLKYPVGINLLELTPGLDEDDAELEKEVVAEGVVSLFRKVFSKEENSDAHRIEYILRNTIYTAFTVQGCTIFTISKILTNPTFRNQVISQLKDEDLKDFWKYEFGKAGNYQVVKMTQGVTAKVGRFLRSPTARRILEQEKSTISFDDIINQGKILICNISQGKLGEDTSRLLGTTIMTKLQQAALKRAYIPEKKRKVFYLYVDEFQNFATQSFTKMITEGRKYRMPLIIAEQSTSQQSDKDIINIILANVTTVVCFRTGNPVDEKLMLGQFGDYIDKGEIPNLPRYKFYIKISAIESEEPFSGTTLYFPIVKEMKKIEQLIEASRKNWAIQYERKETSVKFEKQTINDNVKTIVLNNESSKNNTGFPESKKQKFI